MTLTEAVEQSLKSYPAIRVSEEQINAAAASIKLARTAYLPRVDALAQLNRATRNNTFGLLLPQSFVPSMSGPVIGSNNLGSVWGSAVGVLVTWEPFDFGLRGRLSHAGCGTRDGACSGSASDARRDRKQDHWRAGEIRVAGRVPTNRVPRPDWQRHERSYHKRSRQRQRPVDLRCRYCAVSC